MHPIKKIPPELLARIFITGEDIHRGVRLKPDQPYLGFQDLVAQVCRNWRDVAIRTPTLWTYLYISKPPPHRHAELYISRSGVCPLIIDLSLKRSYIKSLSQAHGLEYADQAGDTIRFLFKSGATPDRWGGLIVSSKLPQSMVHIIGFVNSGPTPVLRFLSLEWQTPLAASEMFERVIGHRHLVGRTAMPQDLLTPQLRHLELDGLPNPYIFNRLSPMVSNLTYLKYASSKSLPSLRDVSTLLAANPRLESLFIDMSAVYPPADQLRDQAINLAFVEFPLLRTLSFNIIPVPVWGLQLLRVINAPKLESFELGANFFGVEDAVLQGLLCSLSRDQVSKDVQWVLPLKTESTHRGSIFPSLQYLNIERVQGSLSTITALLEALPTVAQVTLSLTSLVILSESPLLLPNASHFKFNNIPPFCFKFILRIVFPRAKAGMRIPMLEISTTNLGLVAETSNGEDSDLYKKHVAPLHRFVDKVVVRLHKPEDSKPSRSSHESPS